MCLKYDQLLLELLLFHQFALVNNEYGHPIYNAVNLFRIYLLSFSRRKATPVKNTENVQAAVRKEEQTAAVTSYAAYNETNAYGMPSANTNIYENIRDQDNMYDAPYEETEHYEPSPASNRGRTNVTINGVSVR